MDELTEQLFELEPDQRKAFLKLKKAYKDCEKLGVGFYNLYGSIGAFDTKKISHYNDTKDGGIENNGQNWQNEFKSVDSWADDTHYFHPVNK